MERWEDNLQELVLSFHHMGFGNWTKVIRLGSFLPAQPSHWLLDKYSWISKEIKLGKRVEKRHESSKVHSSYSSSFHLQGEEAVRAAPMVGHSSLGPNFLLCSLPEEQDGMRQPTGGICDIPAPITLCSCVLILCVVYDCMWGCGVQRPVSCGLNCVHLLSSFLWDSLSLNLELATELQESSCLYLPSAGITGMCHHAQLYFYLFLI